MSHIEPHRPATILGRAKMGMKLVNLLAILILAGCGDARPQKPEATPAASLETSNEGWKPVEPSNPSKDVRADSRYTWNSGNTRIPYINYPRNRNHAFAGPYNANSNPRFTKVQQFWRDVSRGPRYSSRIVSKEGSTIKIPSIDLSKNLTTHDSQRATNSKQLNFDRVPVIERFRNAPRFDLARLKNSGNVRVKPGGRTIEKRLNNSDRPAGPALNQKSQLVPDWVSGLKLSLPRKNVEGSNEAESSGRFDQLSAIRRITEAARGSTIDNIGSSSMVPSTKLETMRPGRNGTKLRYSASYQKGDQNFEKSRQPVLGSEYKNWPNEALQDVQDLYNYEKYTSFDEHGQADVDPGSSDSNLTYREPLLDSSVQEIIHWLKIPPFMRNQSHFVEVDKTDDPMSPVFDPVYQDLQPNRPLRPDRENAAQTYQSVSPVDDNRPGSSNQETWESLNLQSSGYTPSVSTNFNRDPVASEYLDSVALKNKTVYKPVTHVSQETVVQILSNGGGKQNVTTAVPAASSNSSASSSSQVFDESKVEFQGDDPEKYMVKVPLITYDQNCPTITINSYTKVNNTIQSKEGCTDLNIIINSHVFNENVFKPSSGETQVGDDLADDKNVYGAQDNSYSTPGHEPVESYGPGSSYTSQSNYPSPDKAQDQAPFVNDAPLEGSSLEVFQGTQISILNSNSQLNPVESLQDLPESPSLAAEDPVESSNGGAGEINAPSLASSDSAGSSLPGEGAGPISGSPGVPAAVEGVESPGSGIVMGQANDAPASTSLQLPSLPGLPNRPNLPNLPSLSDGSVEGSSPLSSLTANNDDDDDEDDDEFSATGLMESMASVVTYLTFWNPFNYGILSLATAPFAAMTAGVLGLAAFLFPWAFPSVFDFGRAADKVTIRFRPNLEEVVRQSMYKYGGLNEWKSKRKKRKR